MLERIIIMKRRGKGKECKLPTQLIKISNPSQGVHNNYKGMERKAPMRKMNFSHCSSITKFRKFNDEATGAAQKF